MHEIRYDGFYVVIGEEAKRNKLKGSVCLVLNGYNYESANNQYDEADKRRS